MEQKNMDYADICDRLLRILHSVVEPTMNLNVDEYTMESHARGLATKYYNHAITIRVLSNYDKDKNVPYLPATTSAFSSIQVLTRAALETFLVFHHIFVAPDTLDEVRFRFSAYALAGCMERGTPIFYSEDYPIGEEGKAAWRFNNDLRQNSIFKSKDMKNQRRILSGKWRIAGWKDIAKRANLSEFISSSMYEYLCGYAHSGSLSVRQTQIIQNLGQQHSNIDSMLLLVDICCANMITNYCDLFPSVKPILLDQPQAEPFVNLWIRAGRNEEPTPELMRSPWRDSYAQYVDISSDLPKPDLE
ncbi:MAG: hypothetical protein NTZ34_06545 [Chloroflexi bacterium]|nr:hypothetical protein [Chloroflexota bacterium]